MVMSIPILGHLAFSHVGHSTLLLGILMDAPLFLRLYVGRLPWFCFKKRTLPSATLAASQWGWHMAAVAKNEISGPNSGGVAVVVQSPWTACLVQKRCTTQGQLAMFAVGAPGVQRLHVFVGYWRPDIPGDLNDTLLEWISAFGDTPWILGSDLNQRIDHGVMCDSSCEVGACIGVTGRHKRGQFPIDVMATSKALVIESGRDLGPSISDHSILELVCSGISAQADLPCWRFASVRNSPPHCERIPEIRRSWHELSCSDTRWKVLCSGSEIDEIWQCWSQDAETWLCAHGFLQEGTGDRALGTSPTLRIAGSRHGPQQSVEERMLRRLVRRVEEVDLQSQSRPDNPQLRAAIRRSLGTEAEIQAFSVSDWPLLSYLVRRLLQACLQSVRERTLSIWRAKLRKFGFVCKWVKRKVAGPHAFRLPDGTLYVFGRAAWPRPCVMLGSPSCVTPSLRSNVSRSIKGPSVRMLTVCLSSVCPP